MARVKFLHCGDIHMDAPFSSLDGWEGSSSIRRQDIKDTFSRIIEKAKKEEVKLLLISGDLYEHHYIKKTSISFISELFKTIPQTEIVLVPGNHDPYLVNSYYKTYPWSENVHILTEDQPFVVFEPLKVCVFGVGFKNFSSDIPFRYSMEKTHPEYINILMVHGTVDLNLNQNAYNATTSEFLDSLEMDYVAMGHFHNRIEQMGSKGRIYNPGSPEPLGYDEMGEHGVFLGTLTKEDDTESYLSIQFVNTNKRVYQSIEVNIQGLSTSEQMLASVSHALEAQREKLGGRELTDGLFCITLKGYLESGVKVDPARFLEFFKGQVFHLKIKDETAVDYNLEEILKDQGIRGLFVRKIYKKLENTQSEYERKLLMKALYFGLEALDTGRVEL